MNVRREVDLYCRGVETLLASWEAYARGAIQASLQRWPGVVQWPRSRTNRSANLQ